MASTTGKNSAVVKHQNLEAVRLMLYQKAPISRTEIADLMGLTPATITNIISELMEEGSVAAIEEGNLNTDTHASGRKRVLLDIVADYRYVLGFSLGREGTHCVLCDMRGNVIMRKKYELMSDEYSVMIHQLQGIISEIRQMYPNEWGRLLGIGISVPGVVSTHRGIVLNHGTERRSWCNQPLGESIAKFASVPVRMENNVRARSCAIRLFDPATLGGKTTFALCHVSLGIACPFVLGNELVRGEDAAAGELGRTILMANYDEKTGKETARTLEDLASVSTMMRLCREALSEGRDTILREICGDPDQLTLDHLLAAQAAGDELVSTMISRSMFYIGIALANIADIINPNLVLLSGGIFSNPLNVEMVEKSLREHLFASNEEAVQLIAADLGEFGGAIGAAACCVEKYYIRK